MVRIVRPDPPLPMTVAIAAKVFGSEVNVGLIRHYRLYASSQSAAALALDLPTQVVSRATRTLVDAGVVVRGAGAGRGRQAGRYIVDDHRVRFLLDELRRYCDPPNPADLTVTGEFADRHADPNADKFSDSTERSSETDWSVPDGGRASDE